MLNLKKKKNNNQALALVQKGYTRQMLKHSQVISGY